MSALLEKIRKARETGEFAELVAQVPYAAFMGITIEVRDGEPIGCMRFLPHQVGNATIPALHGGAIGAILESTAVFKLLWETEPVELPKIVSITIEYLRTARPQDTFVRAEITRQGRRVATVRAVAWQDDPENPVAAANAHFLLAPAES